MARVIGRDDIEQDWRALRNVVVALWLTAGLAFLFAYAAVPQDEDIVLSPAAPVIAQDAVPLEREKTKRARIHMANTGH